MQVARTSTTIEGDRVKRVAIDERVGELPRTIGAEVEVDHDVTFTDPTVHPVDHGWLDELVALVPGVAIENGLYRRGRNKAAAADHRVVPALRPLPALVPIHCVVAATDCCDTRPRMRVP